MEILNNLWLALTTPNENLVNILTAPLYFVEVFLIMYLFLNITGIKSSKYQKILYLVLASLIGIITNVFMPTPYNIFTNYLITILLTYFIFRSTFFKTIISIIIAISIPNLINILAINPFITLLHINTDELNIIPIYKISYILVVYTLISIIGIIIKYKDIKLHFLENIDTKHKSIIFTNLFFGILAIILQSIILFYYVDFLPNLITFLSFISLLAYFAISIYSLTRIFKLILTKQKLQSAEEYNHTLHVLHDNVRGFKHDFDNIVTTIGGFINANDMDGLKNYYKELEDDCQRVNNLYILNPDIINNDGIYNLLTKKYNEADSKNIKVTITFLLDLSTLNMKIYEFARMLGILLDNAIEASSECDEKIINIEFRNDSKNSRQIVRIENTYKNKDIDTDKIFEKGISEKENHTGLGLWEVRKLIKKNNNLNLFTTKNDKFFVQQLEIYY